MEIYNVKEGDSLSVVANNYNVSVDDIVFANDLPYNDELTPGMNLLIPIIDQHFTYTVEATDFLQKVAKKFKVAVQKIIKLNNIKEPFVIYPGQTLKIPKHLPKTKITSLAFFQPKQNYKDYFDYIESIAGILTFLAIFDIKVDESGNFKNKLPKDLISFTKKNNIAPLPVITNFDGTNFNSDLAHNVLTNSMDTLINNIVRLTIDDDYKGALINFENLYPQDRELFNTFIKKLSSALHKNKKLLAMSVAPKWSDWPDRPWVGFLDYKTIGQCVDIAFIMAYEWGYPGGDPQPIAPINLVEKVMTYALDNMPKKVVMLGMNVYGYDWPLYTYKENPARTVDLEDAYKLAIDNGSPIQWNDTAKTPFFNYTPYEQEPHEVHFEDALSQEYKYKLAKELNLNGVGYWVLNIRNTPTWYLLKNMFTVRKVK